MVTEQSSIVHAAGGYGPPGGGYPPGGGGMPPGGGGYGGPPQGGPPPGGGYGGPPQGAPPGGGYGGPPQGGGMPPQGGYGGPPPGGGFGPPGGMMPGAGGDINTTLPLILGIVSIFCCWPAAIFIIIFAVQAKKAKESGDMATATSKAKTATLVGWIIIGLGVLEYIGIIVSQVMAHS